MNYDLLFSTKGEKKLEVAVIGVRGFNHSLFIYGSRNDAISIRILCGRTAQKCIDAYLSVGIKRENIAFCSSTAEGLSAFEKGMYLVFTDIDTAMSMPCDLVVEGTGNPEASARYALSAIEHHKHIVMVTKESDSVVGSLLAKKAREQGVIYSLAEGDQPALLIGLVTWARKAGLSIVSIGKSSEYDFIFDPEHSTMQVLDRTEEVSGFEKVWRLGENGRQTVEQRSALLSDFGQRAIPDLAEMSIVCNHLPEFSPDISSFHCPIARAVEIPDLMCPETMGGLFSGEARIDVINCLRRPDEQSLEGGVYVVVACNDEETWQVLQDKGVPVSRNKKTALIYYPAHYLGFEALFSVLSVGLLGLPTSSPDPRPRYDLVARSVKPMTKGTELQAKGHHHIIEGFEGILLPAQGISAHTQLPYYLADGARLKEDIPAGTLLNADMLERPDDAILWKLREEQDTIFAL